MILSDNETRLDLLNNEAIAKTVIEMLCAAPKQPVTFGVHGDWGAGKSSVLEMIESNLSKEEKILCLKFNGWRFQGLEDAKIVLIEGIVAGLVEERPALRKAADKVKGILRRIDWMKVAGKAGGLAFTMTTGVPSPDMIQTAVSAAKSLLEDPAKLADADAAKNALGLVKDLTRDGDPTSNVPEEINAFRAAFDDLLSAAEIDQLVVLIDDLDRCLPETAIETLEAIRLFVFTSRTAFVVAADEAMIEYAVRRHFPNLPDTTAGQSYARNYLEKLIQVPFRIPTLGEAETRIYVSLLLVGATLGEEDLEYQKLVESARGLLRRPWEACELGPDVVRASLGDKASTVTDALALSDQIGPVLAKGTRGNPRQIKRFLNSLVLRKSTAKARGFGDEINIPVLAKLMLAEQFNPTFFAQMATAAAATLDGICPGLDLLEGSVKVDGEVTAPASDVEMEPPGEKEEAERAAPVEKKGDNFNEQWRDSAEICAWAGIAPPLGSADLRPYLFVAKDRKDYFGGSTALGHVDMVADRLMGSRFAVQALEVELGSLATAESEQVFAAVRSRIMARGEFTEMPDGIDGLAVLAKSQSTLEARLLDFLEALPRDTLGPWVCRGWEQAIASPDAKGRFEQLLVDWEHESNTLLQQAAKTVRRATKGGV